MKITQIDCDHLESELGFTLGFVCWNCKGCFTGWLVGKKRPDALMYWLIGNTCYIKSDKFPTIETVIEAVKLEAKVLKAYAETNWAGNSTI